MSQSLTMDPNLVYQLVASNPNLKNIVEQTAKMMQIQQQMGPTLQQMATNPMAAINGYFNWQGQQQAPQQAVQQPQAVQQTQPAQQVQQVQQVQQPQNTQQGGQSMGMFEQAMGIVDEFRKSFEAMNKNFEIMNNNLKEVHDMCAANAKAIDGFRETQTVSKAKSSDNK